jgi:hypothetical protein
LHGPTGQTPQLDRVTMCLGASSLGLFYLCYHPVWSLVTAGIKQSYDEHEHALHLVSICLSKQRHGDSRTGDSQQGGRSRRFGGEMHGRKLTKDAINVFSQATNSGRTKSWLDIGLVWHVTARSSRYLIIRRTKDIYNLEA